MKVNRPMMYWNCQAHRTFKSGCEDCEQITREMDPEYCAFGMGKRENPHDYQTNEKGILACSRCHRRKPTDAEVKNED